MRGRVLASSVVITAAVGGAPAEPTPPAAPPPVVVIEPPLPPETFDPPLVATPPEPDARIPGSIRGTYEYLLWWMTPGPLPPLATRANRALPLVGAPGTRELFGDTIDLEERSGGRFMFGLPFNKARTTGIETGYWFLGSRTSALSTSGTTDPAGPIIGRPFIDANTGRESAAIIAAPGFQAGAFWASQTARAQGAEVNVVADIFAGQRWQIDGMVGYRFIHLHEGLNLTQYGVMTPTLNGRAPTAFARADDFDCDNQYHGGQIGLRGELRNGPLFLELTGKVAFGQVTEVVRVSGVTGITPPGQPQIVSQGGLLALASNSGRLTREAFAVVPEAIARAGWAWGEHCRFFVGYNFLFLSDVARPGDQIDRTINQSLVPFRTGIHLPGGAERPALVVQSSTIWLQGLLIGVEGMW